MRRTPEDSQAQEIVFEEHVRYLQRMIAWIRSGGSALLWSDFGTRALTIPQKYPYALFAHLDSEWQDYAARIQRDGLGFFVPPVLGIVLSRCARREAIPFVVQDLRLEWHDARRRVWDLLTALRTSPTVGDALAIESELSEASKHFSPAFVASNAQPIRVFWELLAAGMAGAVIAELSGGKPMVGAVAGTLAQAGRILPGFLHEFGNVVFGLLIRS
jgi:hypothetical protein